MTDDLAELEGLQSEAPSKRAAAATWLLQHPAAISTRALMNALQTESVPVVRRILLQALEARQGHSTRPSATDAETEVSLSGGQPRTANNGSDISGIIRHELSPAIGWIRLAADAEIENFRSSKTNDAVRKLQRRVDGLIAMMKSEEPLNLRTFSLSQLLLESWPDAASRPIIEPEATGEPVEIETDEGLFTILLSNVYQNAIDASDEAGNGGAVHVAWGSTHDDFWVRVTNSFNGNRFDLKDVVGLGNSTKPSHQGRGISLIIEVARRLGLTIDLSGTSGTATFSMHGGLSNG